MFIKAEFFARWGQKGVLASGMTLAAAMLGACALGPPPPPAPPAPAASAEIAPAAQPAVRADASALPPAVSAGNAASSAGEPVVKVLTYADRVRTMSAAELNQEVARMGNPYIPANLLQLAIVLAQLRQTPELVRAQDLLTRLLANPDAEAVLLHPLARLLAGRYGEQRRMEELLEKQNQQTRDVQRRLDQTNERLEALKAIERSLTSRPPLPPVAPPGRARTPASAP